MRFKNKRIISTILSFVLILGLMIVPAKVSFAEEAKSLTIVHVNDVHGNVVDNGNDVIGFAKLKAKVDELKAANPNVLLLNAGDTLHGTTFATLSNGESIINLMNLVGFDAMTPGNHEFNYGYERLLELKEMAEFPFLGANILKEEDNTSDFEPYFIKEFEGFKVGVFGLSTEETKVKSHPDNTKGIKFENPVDSAKKMVEELQAEGVDFIVLLAHLGIDEESEITAKTVAENVEGIDIIVDGHSHSDLPEGLLVNDTLIVQAHEWTKKIGVVEITIEDGNMSNIVVKHLNYEETKDLTPDPVILEKITEIDQTNKVFLERVIGKALVDLEGTREVVRKSESNLGNLATDAMLSITGADVVITNGGGIRASIPEGDITVGSILTVFPFTNYPVVIEVSGATIMEALEFGVDAYPEVAGKFPHIAGMKFKLDEAKPVGERVVDLMIGEEPVDLEKTYKLATNDFMAAGGDGYTMFEGATKLAEYPLISEVLVAYVEELGEINPVVEGRIAVIPAPVVEEEPVEEPAPEPVPEPTPEPAPVPEPEVKKYIVKPGDVLWKIAELFNTTWEKLAEFNNLKNPHLIFPNQEILIPAE